RVKSPFQDPKTAISHGELFRTAISTRILAFDTPALSARPYVSCLLLVREALPPFRAYCTLV
ncbi:hypothetical protein, partial [Bifidobacterium bifidum]|uniref:hypothetical protein n=1 Tax=Bifidobacterium bifidum TaxID=1681 RepID=UPI001A7E0FCC